MTRKQDVIHLLHFMMPQWFFSENFPASYACIHKIVASSNLIRQLFLKNLSALEKNTSADKRNLMLSWFLEDSLSNVLYAFSSCCSSEKEYIFKVYHFLKEKKCN